MKHMKGFAWDPFAISIAIFAIFIAMLPLMGLGQTVTQQTIHNNPEMNASEVATLNNINASWFQNTPDIAMFVIYIMLILACFVAAGYEGANPAVTLLLGLFFVVIAEIVSFGIADFAHAYATQPQFANELPHVPLTTYVLFYLPYFNGVLTIAYLVFVIMRREVITNYISGGGGGVGAMVST